MTPNDKGTIVFFDNNQILARNWNVKDDSKPLVSVITTLISLLSPVDTHHQKNPDLSLMKWLRNVNPGEVIQLLNTKDLNTAFRKYRNEFIGNLLKELSNEQINENSVTKDDLDSSDEASRRVYFDDNSKLSYEINRKDPYESITSHCTGKTEVKILDPIDLNPCS